MAMIDQQPSPKLKLKVVFGKGSRRSRLMVVDGDGVELGELTGINEMLVISPVNEVVSLRVRCIEFDLHKLEGSGFGAMGLMTANEARARRDGSGETPCPTSP